MLIKMEDVWEGAGHVAQVTDFLPSKHEAPEPLGKKKEFYL
jgi:hypothetical protein